MLASYPQTQSGRRGIVLVLVLAMLGLLALVGVTFATFAGQARINNRNYQQSLLQPQGDELLDFALQQLISDTNDVRSVIRGHSLLRDMYGTGSNSNGYLQLDPTTGAPFYITTIKQVGTSSLYNVTVGSPVNGTMKPLLANDPNFYGYNFTRWIMRVGGSTANGVAGSVNQTFEILVDSQFNVNGGNRTFTINIGPTDGQLIYNQVNSQFVPVAPGTGANGTNLYNPTVPVQTILPGQALLVGGNAATAFPFQLDGRWLHAFNGPGMGSTTSSVTGISNAAYGNMRHISSLNPLPSNVPPFGPNSVGMDEDYDACDLENWFLAIQSADGNVIIPSFHRPANIRFDPTNTNAFANVNDWTRTNYDGPGNTNVWASSAARILRPCQADGNDAATFGDLTPGPNGQINYDVDNDGDGTTDSVWLDLGYPARPDASGRLYKPLFAFMVIGLNGRIPLNTAGNLAGTSQSQAEHLGNSTSELDPTYGLQNAYNGDYDPFDVLGYNFPLGTYPNGAGAGNWGPSTNTNNGQVDNTLVYGTGGVAVAQGIDVRLTQLRNILAGTRPQTNPLANPTVTDPSGTTNGDNNGVYGSWVGLTAGGQPYYMPNGIADLSDAFIPGPKPASNPIFVQRTTNPVPGRWGEAQSIPGVPFPNPTTGAPPYNWVQTNYTNPVRAGYSFDITDFLTGLGTYNGNTTFPRDAADDNFNAFDPYPAGHLGEVTDSDFFDAAGANLLPVERMRRWVTPADINGTGRVVQWNVTPSTGPNPSIRGAFRGADNFGRVQFSSYFRPAGDPGVMSVLYTYTYNTTTGAITVTPIDGSTLGAIYYPTGGTASGSTATDYAYGGIAPNPINPIGIAGNMTYPLTPAATLDPNYLPDVTNNPFHGFEAYKIPNLFQNPYVTPFAGVQYNPQLIGGMPIDQGVLYATATTATATEPGGGPGLALNVPATYAQTTTTTTDAGPTVPAFFPTYDFKANQSIKSDGLNEADEMNLYNPSPLLDSPYGPGDLEWLYRQQDVDGSTLSSRLSQLAPISFTNTIDGLRRRRLYSLDSWEPTNFIWANDNPGNAFANNARFTQTQSASLVQSGTNQGQTLPTPSLAHRDKKINLNYPLPVSNDPNEPVRQKWIRDAYYMLKGILPPDAIDTAEELAQLSQYVINIVDFRDPDGTMTHWVNPDVVMMLPTTATPIPYPPSLSISLTAGGNLDQYGMEYNPVAINETMAYSFQSVGATAGGTGTAVNRFFIELVNTLPAAYNPGYDYSNPTTVNNYYGNASAVTLGGFSYTTGDPYSGGCWDLVFTNDDPLSRPDPYRGELAVGASVAGLTTSYYGLIPLNRDSFPVVAPATAGNPTLPNSGDVTLLPVSPTATSPNNPLNKASVTTLPTGSNYFYVIGNQASTLTTPTEGIPPSMTPVTTAAGITGGPSLTQTLLTSTTTPTTNYDPFNGMGGPTMVWYPGVLPGVVPSATGTGPYSAPTNYAAKIPALTVGSAKNYWVCLRRPANPFAPVSAANPMCVVDSMRFPYVEGTGGTIVNATDGSGNSISYASGTFNTIYSAQRLQPYRGGHAVAAPNNYTGTLPVTTNQPPDPRYGYTEQIAVPQTPALGATTGNYGIYFQQSTTKVNYYATLGMFHTLGAPNDSAENWDYLVFNDRDFTSVAELMLVPGCPPGLFTKQFCEAAPSQINAADIFAAVTPVMTPTFTSASGSTATGVAPAAVPATAPLAPFATASVPYLSISQATNGNVYPTPTTTGAKQQTTLPQSTGTTQPSTGTLAVPPLNSTTYLYSALSLAQPSTGITSPVQPHSFPYLVDKFFYTGASNFLYPPTQLATDPSVNNSKTATYSVVGGPAADGWFKMFDFFEVPSQMIAAVGPVATGFNFDWARQDSKPGLININLIIDEEVFFSVFGRQDSSLNQTELNSMELPFLATNGVLPYSMPLSTQNSGNPPILNGGPPIPLVVSAVTATGAPNYVYPITNQSQSMSTEEGILLENDPMSLAINVAGGASPMPPSPGNRIKAAFAQFLWLRHGGSGYLFGYGSGATGQNSAVGTVGLANYAGALPAERYFRSLSFPDINYTIMRPAALPPSTVSLPAMLPDASSSNPAVIAVANAQALLYQPATVPTSPGPWYFCNGLPTATNLPLFYAPYTTPATGSSPVSAAFLTPFTTLGTPVVYTGDPGVRNPLLSIGYTSSSGAAAYPVTNPPTGTGQATNTVPLGIPLPVNVAFPAGVNTTTDAENPPFMDAIVMPPAIPPRRLFQPVDGYGSVPTTGFVSALSSSGYTGTTTLPPPTSNASDGGDPWINNQIPFNAQLTGNPINESLPAPTGPLFTLNNGFSSLTWTGGAVSNITTTTPAVVPLPPTGALPPVSAAYPPYSLTAMPTGLLALSNYFNTNSAYNATTSAVPNSVSDIYLGTGSGGTSNTDDRQHPYWRSEMLQKAMNLTTVRTHQYAVWITIGFFQVKRQGDLLMFATNPQFAFDIMGPEIGAANGKTTRYRGFYLVDRLQLTGFNPTASASFRNAVVYANRIQ